VLRAAKDGDNIVYTLDVGHTLLAGQSVEIEIDWIRRYRLMRLRFAAELVLELMYRLRPGIGKVGAHIAADKARIDFVTDENISTLFGELSSQANAIIESNQHIISAFSEGIGERRYWQIAGFAQVPCGGTHLRRTSEVGPISLKRKNIGKGKERIEIFLADNV
jgi:Ser-tRNA(Ala) deacylase AlaX